MADSLTFADVGEELIAKTFAFRSAGNEAGDIDELHSSGDDFVGVIHFGQDVKALVWDGNDADIWLDSSKRIVGGESASIGERIK